MAWNKEQISRCKIISSALSQKSIDYTNKGRLRMPIVSGSRKLTSNWIGVGTSCANVELFVKQGKTQTRRMSVRRRSSRSTSSNVHCFEVIPGLAYPSECRERMGC